MAVNSGSDLGPIAGHSGAIVLVHGAWVGEYCWDRVRKHLETSGRSVHAISLTGHGNRAHLNGPHIDLQTHIEDVVHAIESLDLSDITLAGHSYGGRVITGAFEAIGDRVAHIVYLDAHAPVSAAGTEPDFEVGPDDMIPFASFKPDPHIFDDVDSAQDFVNRAVAQSAQTIASSPMKPLPDGLDKTYVFASAELDKRFAPYAAAARDEPGWRVIELSGSHWLMVSHASEVAAIIDDPKRWNPKPASTFDENTVTL